MNKNFTMNKLGLRHAPASALLAATIVALTACGGQTAVEAGEELIEGELETALGFGELTEASCDAPASETSGETFACTAVAPSGETVDFSGVMRSESEIFIASSNVIFVEDLDFLEEDAVQAASENFEVDPSTLAVDCPDENTFVVDDQITCEITDSSDGGIYDLTVTLEAYVLDEGFPGWSYSLGDRKN
ncbi:MAG: hypothetical protein AB8G14_06110 [Ilumatobacter sp.]